MKRLLLLAALPMLLGAERPETVYISVPFSFVALNPITFDRRAVEFPACEPLRITRENPKKTYVRTASGESFCYEGDWSLVRFRSHEECSAAKNLRTTADRSHTLCFHLERSSGTP